MALGLYQMITRENITAYFTVLCGCCNYCNSITILFIAMQNTMLKVLLLVGLRDDKKLLLSLVILISLFGCNKEEVYDSDVYYEIFVASFNDSDNDGIGDLKGVTLSYLI